MIKFDQQELHVCGKIDYSNAEQYYRKGLQEIQAQARYLSQLEQGSTLALAVLVRWLRQTPDARGLQFKAVPAKMLNIIQACHLQNDLQLL